MNNILVVDSHPLYLDGLCFHLDQFSNIQQIFRAHSVKKAFAVLKDGHRIHLIIMELDLPNSDGVESLRRFRRQFPLVPIMVLSNSENLSDMNAAMSEGARGYIVKSEKTKIVLQVIRIVLEGGFYVPPQMIQYLQRQDVIKISQKSMGEVSHNSLGHEVQQRLTTRQKEILVYVADGLTNKEISQLLCVTEATVKSHVTAILKTLNIKNRSRVVKLVSGLGIEQPIFN